ncbi:MULTISPECIES: type II toxin-antitoxin system VapC family toxin [unclassified Frankia]|uniref:type II toxin-antitoxin system VapC family toxin n=1 Tax=unclassified Frankia TaxID=2632575 RepID=UPI002AD5703B|nr:MULTISPECIES: type II toxin-antitoxin system VapC family toxin [unclassified Frankia]
MNPLAPGRAASRLWEKSDHVVSPRLLSIETAAALAQAKRMRRIDETTHGETMTSLDRPFSALDVVTVNDRLVRRAAILAHDLGLRGYDAVHYAAAEQLASPELVVATGGRILLQACRELGMATVDTSG